MSRQLPVPVCVLALAPVMARAVDFHGETQRRTVEVDDPAADGVLTPELESQDLPTTQGLPHREL